MSFIGEMVWNVVQAGTYGLTMNKSMCNKNAVFVDQWTKLDSIDI